MEERSGRKKKITQRRRVRGVRAEEDQNGEKKEKREKRKEGKTYRAPTRAVMVRKIGALGDGVAVFGGIAAGGVMF